MNQKSVLEGSRRALGSSWRPRSKRRERNANFWGLLEPSWGGLGGLLKPSWRLDRRPGPPWAVLGRLGALLSRLKIDVKIDQKIDAVQDRFLGDFTGFWEGKWRHVGPKIEQKSMPTSKSDFLKNRALPAAGARFSRFWVSNLRVKINEKSIENLMHFLTVF